MADSIRVGIALDDLVSGPAKKAAKGVRGVTSELGKLDKKLKKADQLMAKSLFAKGGQFGERTKMPVAAKIFQGIGRTFGPQASGKAIRFASALGRADDGLKQIGSSLGGVASAAASGIGAAVSAVAVLTAALAAAGVAAVYLGTKLAVSFGKAALAAGAFRETSLLSFETLLKSKKAADDVFKSAVKMASVTPFKTTDVVSSFKSLLGFGFKTTELERTFTAIGDLAAIKGDPTLLGRLAVVFGQIKGKGKLQGDELLQLAEAGLSTADVMDALAKSLGKNRSEILKMQAAGKISSEMAIEAILSTIEKKFGGGMGKLSATLTGLISTLVSRPTELFFAAFDRPGGLSRFAKDAKDAIKFLADSLNPASERGQRVVKIIDQLGAGLAELTGEFSVADMGKAFDKLLTFTEDVLPGLGQGLKGFATGFASGFKPILDWLGGTTFNPDDPRAFGEALGKIGSALGFIAGAALTLGVVLTGVLAVGVAIVAGAALSLASLFIAASAAVYGLIYGIVKLYELMSGNNSLSLGMENFAASFSPKNILGAMVPDGLSGAGLLPDGLGANAFAAPGGFGYSGASVPAPSLQAETRGQKRGEGGPKTTTFTLNISGAGLTPDELIARARAEFKGMLAELDL